MTGPAGRLGCFRPRAEEGSAREGRRPLYLLARSAHNVRAEAQSLAVYRGRICSGRYPVRRLSRVVASLRVEWRGEALALCLGQGIPILFVDLRGTPRGSCLPALRRSAPLDELLDELTDDSTWQRYYGNFLRHVRGRVLRRWARERAGRGRPFDEAEWSLWMRAFVYQGESPVEPDYDIGGILRSIVELYLHRAGVRARYWAHGGGELDLAGDIAAIARGRLLMQAGPLLLQNGTQASTIRLVEGGAADVERTVQWALACLQRYLSAWAQRWL